MISKYRWLRVSVYCISYTCVRSYAYVYAFVRVLFHINRYLYKLTYDCMFMDVCLCMCVFNYKCTYVCVYVGTLLGVCIISYT